MAIKDKVYTLDDGTEWTTKQLAKETGLGKSTMYHRVARLGLTDPEKVLAKSKQGRSKYERPVEWKDDPVEVYGGIPMNPYYMDGQSRVNHRGLQTVDRYGEILTQAQKNALMKYREKQRSEWRKERKDNITGDK